MTMFFLIQLLSTLGGAALIYNYYKTAVERTIDAKSGESLSLVFLGSGLLTISAGLAGVAGFFLLDAFWCFLAFLALQRIIPPPVGGSFTLARISLLSFFVFIAVLGPGLFAASTSLVQAAGILGGLFVVAAWHGSVKGYAAIGSARFNCLNFTGALILLVVGVITQVWGTVILDAFWAHIAASQLLKAHKKES